MTRLVLISLISLGAQGCVFTAWDVGGPWACADGGACPEGYTCDDAVCCRPGSTPVCPTLPAPDGTCPPGSKPAFYLRDQDGDGAGDPAVRRAFCRAPVREAWVVDAPERKPDCNDRDVAIGPLATERCNALDDDCDGEVDDGLSRQPWFRDVDGDHFGDDKCSGCVVQACAQPVGLAERAGDCNDGDPGVFPGAPESCDGVDQNCNGQRDDPPFLDAESPGQPMPVVPCNTGLLGACQVGATQCLFSAGGADAGFVKRCVAPTPSTDVCGDGVDNDCSGGVDDKPGCGGPDRLLQTAGVTFGALVFPDAGALASRCLKAAPGSAPMAFLNPSWIGTGGGIHVWYAEAPAGQWWDLSGATRLRLPFQLSTVGGVSTPWAGGLLADPVIQLCSEDEQVLQRYTPTQASQQFGTGGITLVVPLRPQAGDAWSSATLGSGFSLSRVVRLEVIVSPVSVFPDGGAANGVTFTNRLETDAGVVGFE